MSSVPDREVARTAAIEDGIAAAALHLGTDAALAAIAEDTYWPKWDGPWWHMVLLWELGEARSIPTSAARAMVDGLNALPLHTFPIREEDWPPGLERARAASCHCALGSIDQVLSACGIDVDRELPWIQPWFARYQLSDGGLNCDESAYLVTDECASSMVGTIAPFEAMLRRGPSPFVERGAAFLVERALHLGSSTNHNADERTAATAWPLAMFPRFYLYDVLRGASALARWATLERRPIPLRAVALLAERRDPIVRVERTVPALRTWRGDATGTWRREPTTSTFPLLAAVSELGAPSATLTAEWQRTRHALIALIDAGLLR